MDLQSCQISVPKKTMNHSVFIKTKIRHQHAGETTVLLAELPFTFIITVVVVNLQILMQDLCYRQNAVAMFLQQPGHNVYVRLVFSYPSINYALQTFYRFF